MTQPASTNPDLIKLAISIGVDRTGELLRRQNRLGQPTRNLVSGKVSISIAGYSDRLVQENDSGVLVVTGCPVGSVQFSGIDSAESAVAVFNEAEGAFAAIYWDKLSQELSIITDFIGAQPLYVVRDGQEIHIASETKAFQADPDPAGWGAFLAFGHMIGSKTLGKGIERLPGASVIRIEPAGPTISTRKYWSIPDRVEVGSDGDFIDAFRRSLNAYIPYGRDGALLLSGGFDSRLILFGLLEAGIQIKSRIVEHRDENMDADGKFAVRLAKSKGIDFDIVALNPDFFSSAEYLDYISDTDAETMSLHLFIAQVAQAVAGPSMWEGWALGAAVGSRHFSDGGFDGYLENANIRPDSLPWRGAEAVLNRDHYQAIRDGFEILLDEELGRYTDNDNGVYWFNSLNKSRYRHGANTFKAFPQRATVCAPGFSKELWTLGAGIPHSDAGYPFYNRIFKDYYPGALKVPFVSGSTVWPGRGLSPYYWATALGLSVAQFVSRRPRLAHLAPALSRFNQTISQSEWLDSEILDGTDDWIDRDAVSRLNPDSPPGRSALEFLFYWKVWRALHDGQLYETFRGQKLP